MHRKGLHTALGLLLAFLVFCYVCGGEFSWLIREREHGTVEHLLVMPITPFEIMTAKVWSMGLVVLAASAFCLFFVIQGR